MTEPAPTTPPTTPPIPPTPPTPPAVDPSAPKPEDDAAKALKDKLTAAEKELKAFRDKEKAAADADKTAAEKLAEREKELASAKREALVERVRRANGFGDKVYDVVAASGDTEDEIKAAYEAHKTALDEYVKAQGVKAAPGGGTGGGKQPAGEGKPNTAGKSFLEKTFPELYSKAV